MISRKSAREIERMRAAGRIVAEALDLAGQMVRPGVTTREVEQEVAALIRSRGGEPCFLNYRGFPGSICTSVNEEVVHGLPDGRELVDGDIVGIDIGVRHRGYIGDAARTYAVGRISPEARRLLDVTEKALQVGVATVGPGVRVSAIGAAIQGFVEGEGFSVVREYTGHGVGTEMHEEPQIPNYVDPAVRHRDPVLRPGYVIAIEPMVNAGTCHTARVQRRGWDVVVTRDGRLSAHFEHTVAVTENGPEVLTVRDG